MIYVYRIDQAISFATYSSVYLAESMRHAVCAVPRDSDSEREHQGTTRGRNEGPKDRREPERWECITCKR